MKIFMIWARSHGEIWLVDAWDDDSISGNSFGWTEAKTKARADHGPDNVSVTVSQINFEAVRKSFEPPEVGLSNPEKS